MTELKPVTLSQLKAPPLYTKPEGSPNPVTRGNCQPFKNDPEIGVCALFSYAR
jgi:hypothetical protein